MLKTMPSLARTTLQCLLFAAGGLYLGATHAADAGRQDLTQVKNEAKRQYDADKKKCDALTGNAEDVCEAEAKLNRVTAISSAEARSKGTPKAAHEARKEIADARHELAKERCEDQQGNAKDVCKKEAKAAHVTALADAEAAFKTGKAWDDAAEDKVEAQRDAAQERCESMSGDAKAACMDRAKSIHQQTTVR